MGTGLHCLRPELGAEWLSLGERLISEVIKNICMTEVKSPFVLKYLKQASVMEAPVPLLSWDFQKTFKQM